jgi:hypothetical protein
VSRKLWLTSVSFFLSFALLRNSIAQQSPSVPTSEATITAGQPFSVNVTLQTTAQQEFQASIIYTLSTQESTQNILNRKAFQCRGNASVNQQTVRLNCSTDRTLPSGEYRTNGKITLSRAETGDSKQDDARAPIITIVANPYAETQFPAIASLSLSLSDRQSLADGAVRAQDILNSLSAHLPAHPRDTREYRDYLREEIESARMVVDLTRRRYIGAGTSPGIFSDQRSGAPVPIFFEDFDRRLRHIISDLGYNPSSPSARVGTPHIVLAQMPKTTDSITVMPKPGTLDKNLSDFVQVLTDIIKGFAGMSETGNTTFTWSATTTPPGAEIWYSRLGEAEKKWSGMTNLTGQKLSYAIWTFRIVWGDCYKSETPNPYQQSPINIQLVETGCKRP